MANRLRVWCFAGLLSSGTVLAGAMPMQAAPASASDSFRLPSGHLGCAYEAGDPDTHQLAQMRCDVSNVQFKVAQLPDCHTLGISGDSLILRAQGKPEWICHGDTVLFLVAPLLPYGQSWSRAGTGISCLSDPKGVRCINRDLHGFELSRGHYRLF